MSNSFNKYIESSIVDNWNHPALTDWQGYTLHYHDVARIIAKLHIAFEHAGIRPGDKIAICGRNSSRWAVAFFATLTYGAVAVPILPDFNSEQIHNIVNHSEARLLFVGDYVAKLINPEEMPDLLGVIYLPDLSIFHTRYDEVVYVREHLNEMFGKRYPSKFTRDDIHYYNDAREELAVINYTSGTTGFSKGVMIPYRALLGNLMACNDKLGTKLPKHSRILCTLPMAHTYGMSVEMVFGMANGYHQHYLTRLPSPTLICEALREIKPAIVTAVPLVVEKIIKKYIQPKYQNYKYKTLCHMPGPVGKRVRKKICDETMQCFGGEAYEVITGGAALSRDIESFLFLIGFPITQGYGTTETAPLITLSDFNEHKVGSCGVKLKNMDVRIDSSDPENIPGEIIVRGDNVMLGYYKNDEATAEVIDAEGFYHTGDLATMDSDGNVFIRGRIKNMLLGANGQNIYPEEIEDKINSLPVVMESLVIQKEEKLIALVVPDKDEAANMGLDEESIRELMEVNRNEINGQLPAYCRIAEFRIHEEEFQKTPKKSIKRYLYK